MNKAPFISKETKEKIWKDADHLVNFTIELVGSARYHDLVDEHDNLSKMANEVREYSKAVHYDNYHLPIQCMRNRISCYINQLRRFYRGSEPYMIFEKYWSSPEFSIDIDLGLLNPDESDSEEKDDCEYDDVKKFDEILNKGSDELYMYSAFLLDESKCDTEIENGTVKGCELAALIRKLSKGPRVLSRFVLCEKVVDIPIDVAKRYIKTRLEKPSPSAKTDVEKILSKYFRKRENHTPLPKVAVNLDMLKTASDSKYPSHELHNAANDIIKHFYIRKYNNTLWAFTGHIHEPVIYPHNNLRDIISSYTLKNDPMFVEKVAIIIQKEAPEVRNPNTGILCFKNRRVNINTWEEFPVSGDVFCTELIDSDIAPEKKALSAPAFHTLLELVCDNFHDRERVKEVMGYLLTRDTAALKMFLTLQDGYGEYDPIAYMLYALAHQGMTSTHINISGEDLNFDCAKSLLESSSHQRVLTFPNMWPRPMDEPMLSRMIKGQPIKIDRTIIDTINCVETYETTPVCKILATAQKATNGFTKEFMDKYVTVLNVKVNADQMQRVNILANKAIATESADICRILLIYYRSLRESGYKFTGGNG